MSSPLGKHIYRNLKQHAGTQLATFIVLSATFTVISISLLIHQNLDQVLSSWGDDIKMSVFLKDNITIEQKEKVRSQIETLGPEKNIKFISKADAAKDFQKQISKFAPSLFRDNEFGNPLPASFELSFKKQLGNSEYSALLGMADSISKLTGIDEVLYGQGWVENYAGLVDSFHTSSLFLIIILLTGSLFVVGNSIRNSISQRREEIEVLELVGGTKWSIQGPYLFEGFLLGLAASILAILVSYVVFNWQQSLMNFDLGMLSGQKSMSFLSLNRQFLVLFLGSVFGVLGAFISVIKVCNGWAAASTE